jgi:hemolysin III
MARKLKLSTREHWADAAVHALGVCLGVAGAIVMLWVAIGSPHDGPHGGPHVGQVVPAAVYVFGLLAMLGCSATYNIWRSCRSRDWLRRLDHAAIFVMIAGTYTPLAVRLPGAWAIGLTAGVWSAAAAGVVTKLCRPRGKEAISIALYLALGWCGLIAIEPLTASLPGATLALLLAGGVIYSVGVVFHAADKLPYGRALWHASVLLAAAVHYAALLSMMMNEGRAPDA